MENLNEVNADKVELTAPSGHVYTIRQQTGEDDDILSNANDSSKGISINKFIAAIIVDQDLKPGKKLDHNDILDMKLCDKYFLLIASRIFSLGNLLKFSYEWPGYPPVEYIEDLDNYVFDYSKASDFPFDIDHPLYNQYRIKPHPEGKSTHKEFSLPSGKKFRFQFQNGRSELYILKLNEMELSKNHELIARNLEMFHENQWLKVFNFKPFTAREMLLIRKEVEESDPNIELVTDIINPNDTSNRIKYPLVASTDFFFPREI